MIKFCAGFLGLLLIATVCPAALTVGDLKCNFQTDPTGIDTPTPRLGWILSSDVQGDAQTAYQVVAASTPALLDTPDLWDSGKVASDESVYVTYGGKAFGSSQQVHWRICAWDKSDKPSAWSKSATWTAGILDASEWKARWIAAPADMIAPTLALRKQFDVKTGLKRAVVHISGLGQYEMTLNGNRVGNDMLAPGWTAYRKTCLYDTYDITVQMKPGANAVGVLLGNGMYNVTGGRYTKFKGSFGPLKAIAQIRLEYADGSMETIGTDRSWRVTPGLITFSCVFGGEDWDARLEQPGWDSSGFDDRSWKPAAEVDGPGGQLRGQSAAAPPIRVVETRVPVSKTELRPGVVVYDMGQNASYMLRIAASGPAGSSLKITPAELLRNDGSVNRGSTGGGQAYWLYTLRGQAPEQWTSRFFYHGCRYLQVESTGDATLDSLEGLIVQSISEPIGEFACSNDLFNQTRTLIRWAQRSNMVSVLSDCPHRERLGWLEQLYLNGPSLRYEFDLNQFFWKAMNDMADSQSDDGLIPDIAPEYVVFGGGFRDSPEWGSAYIQSAWQQYEMAGDRAMLERHYDGMKRYVAYLNGKSLMGIVSHGLGDWYDIGPKAPGPAQLTPKSLTATAIFYSNVTTMQKIARLLGKTTDAAEFDALAQQIHQQFNRELYDPQKGSYATGSQTSNAMPLVVGLVEDANRPAVLDALVKDVRDRGDALTAGDIGHRYLLRALAENGRSDVVFDIHSQSERPSYGYQLKHGKTALTEGWAGTGSQNHFMLGHIIEWFYHDVAGIQPAPDGPGFKKIVIKPTPVGDLTWAKATYRSVRGPIISDWKRDGERFSLRVVIPVGSTARVVLPDSTEHEVASGEYTLTGRIGP